MARTMTTIKPHLVRADTIDLQAQDAPSAKDHTRQPTHPSPYGYGPAAPHQAQTLRRAEQEAYQLQHTSPRASEERGQGPFSDNHQFYDEPEDEVDDEHMNHLHSNNGSAEHDRDYDEAEASDSHDEDMDDDLMDKISSSPSIEDGKYSLPLWPPRADSVDRGASPASPSTPTRGSPDSSSLFLTPPVHFPLAQPKELDYGSESHPGENLVKNARVPESSDLPSEHEQYSTPSLHQAVGYYSTCATRGEYANDPDMEAISKFMIPLDDPLLADICDECDSYQQFDQGFYGDEEAWDDEDVNMPDFDSSSDDSEEFSFSDDDRFIDSGWGGECLRDLEDIDFEFVYALHTFVATVEGQANATKGDTMVLLDDSNSYWWLVRVVKDGSIGYLPAEHIETPTERLARLNKHRNIDLSASMLGDNPEKSKNPLKKAMRRRNAKTVAFTTPTYYEPSEYDYSDEEEGDENQMDLDEPAKTEDSKEQQKQQTESTAVQNQQAESTSSANGIQRVASNDSLSGDRPSSPIKAHAPEPLSISHQDSVSRSRKGNVRNTDSFFKDDTAETKKISLTPRLLRGDSDSTGSGEQDIRQRPSLDTFDKFLDEKPKDEKKKEKKGMLSGLFKRKEKGIKGAKGDDRADKTSEELSRHSLGSKDSLDSFTKSEVGPERKPSKLQKQPPGASISSPKPSPTEARTPQRDPVSASEAEKPPAPTGPAPAPPTVRPVRSEDELGESQKSSQPTSQQPVNQGPNRFPSLQEKRPEEKRSIFSPLTTALKSSPTSGPDEDSQIKPVYSKRAKERFALEASDSEDDQTPTAGPYQQGRRSVSPLVETSSHQRNDSGMQISPIEATTNAEDAFRDANAKLRQPDEESVDRPAEEVTPIDNENTASTSKPSPSTATTHTPSTSRSTPTWSDASLRTYMENDQDIRDLLIIVHDKSNVTPVGSDHPLMANLFSNERSKLTEMQTQLDSMLMNWMSRKNSSLLSR